MQNQPQLHLASIRKGWRVQWKSDTIYFIVLSWRMISVVLMHSWGVSTVCCRFLSHTDFSSILQGFKSFWYSEQEQRLFARRYLEHKRDSQRADAPQWPDKNMTWPQYSCYTHFIVCFPSLLSGRWFSPGYTPDQQHTMAMKNLCVTYLCLCYYV